ncbi:hypothetical protein JZ751_020737 [Albula glossodonta]|uniref:Uncharacterized protein n=1 Tax=Albula glossodonta TaxID=121402 RepID=A0A8T2PII4_9TELE|nr:hypothetical protein JZ751_020737 [Albula glossodonta]
MTQNLSNISLVAVLEYIQKNFTVFLQLPRHKQTAWADLALSVLDITLEDSISGAALDLLGPLFLFLDRDTFRQVDREALRLRLEDLKAYCLPKDILTEVASILTDRGLFGEASSWTMGDLEHAGRLVFALSPRQITSIPLVKRIDMQRQVNRHP